MDTIDGLREVKDNLVKRKLISIKKNKDGDIISITPNDLDEETLNEIYKDVEEEKIEKQKLKKIMEIIKIEAEIHGVPIVAYNPTTKQIEHRYADGTVEIYKQL